MAYPTRESPDPGFAPFRLRERHLLSVGTGSGRGLGRTPPNRSAHSEVRISTFPRTLDVMSSLYLARQKPEDRHHMISKLHNTQSGHCFICELPVDLVVHKSTLDIDHVVPLNVGGKDDPSNFALEVTSRSVRVHALPPRDQIDKLVRAYIVAIKDKNNWAPLARALYDQVLAPAISGHPASVTIVPDGSLHLIPFAALLNATNEYAFSSMAITSVPSATVFYILRTTHDSATAKRAFLGVAYSPDSQVPNASSAFAQRAGVFNGQPLTVC